MNTLSRVTVCCLSNGKEYDALAWKQDDGSYSVTWTEGGLRLSFRFQGNGVQIGTNKYKLIFQTAL
jgi:hypothetical protein